MQRLLGQAGARRLFASKRRLDPVELPSMTARFKEVWDEERANGYKGNIYLIIL